MSSESREAHRDVAHGSLLPPPPGLSSVSVGGLNSSQRTTSFANLAAIVGEGLAESMDDSFVQSSYVRKFQSTASRGAEFSEAHDNFHRQSKHSKSRMLGSTFDEFGHQSHAHPTYSPKNADNSSFLFPQSSGSMGVLSGTSGHPLLGVRVAETTSAPVHTLFGREKDREHLSSVANITNSLGSLIDRMPHRGYIGDSDSSGGRSSSPTDRTTSTATTSSTAHSGLAAGSAYNQPSREALPAALNAVFAHPSSPPCWQQLVPFLKLPRNNSPPCSGLLVLGVFSISSSSLRSACEVFGSLHNFRTDFLQSRGIAFVSYFDERAAKAASINLFSELAKFAYNQGGSPASHSHVFYCTPLHYSSQKDETGIIIKNLPDTIEEEDIYRILSSYGDIKKINEQVANDENSTASFLVKFYDSQDSKQAHLELSSSNPWGPGVSVGFSNHTSSERKSGRQLLELIGLWRHGPAVKLDSTQPINESKPASSVDSNSTTKESSGSSKNDNHNPLPGDSSATRRTNNSSHSYPHSNVVYPPNDYYANQLRDYNQRDPYGQSHVQAHHMHTSHHQHMQASSHQVAMTHDGHLVMIQSNPNSYGAAPYGTAPYSNQTLFNGQHHQYQPHMMPEGGRRGRNPSGNGEGGGGEKKGRSSHNGRGKGDDPALVLDLKSVVEGIDTRTSLMVRNIPNKYTQKMFLDEIREGGHGDKIDFFYLPIDFKNKCNRGYAFVNFVNSSDIVPFYNQYNTMPWKNFNSEKVCAITYARIQGKAAMVKRFENSALMDKEDEYRPVVFNLGKVEKFPAPSTSP